jgi:hypothetical protein
MERETTYKEICLMERSVPVFREKYLVDNSDPHRHHVAEPYGVDPMKDSNWDGMLVKRLNEPEAPNYGDHVVAMWEETTSISKISVKTTTVYKVIGYDDLHNMLQLESRTCLGVSEVVEPDELNSDTSNGGASR